MWYYNDKLFEETPEEYQGFVYQITEVDSNKKYIGKKNFWKPKILPITKTRKRRVRTRTESNWKEYYSSSDEVCHIMRLSYSLIMMSYFVKTFIITLLGVRYTQNI